MRIISTERSQVLAARVAAKLGVPLVETKFTRFPDGEMYLRCGELDDETLIVSSTVDNDMFVQTLLLIDAADRSKNTLVAPYLGYSRQDRRFVPGEPISARAVARALSAGTERAFVVNIHDPGVPQHFGVPAKNITIAPAIGVYRRPAPEKPPDPRPGRGRDRLRFGRRGGRRVGLRSPREDPALGRRGPDCPKDHRCRRARGRDRG